MLFFSLLKFVDKNGQRAREERERILILCHFVTGRAGTRAIVVSYPKPLYRIEHPESQRTQFELRDGKLSGCITRWFPWLLCTLSQLQRE
jgi:hypothetical protein